MGNCIGTDVSNKYAAGGDAEGNSVYAKQSQKDEAQAAVSLLNGSLAYSTWIELMISCQHLVSKDALSKSDPMAVLYAKVDGKWQEAGRTEFATNDHNPVFVKRFRILFNFEKVQEMKAYIVDVDSRQDPAKIDPNKCTATPRLQPTDCNPQTATPRLQPPDCNLQTATPRLQPPDCNPQTVTPRLQPPDYCNPQTVTPRLQSPDCNPRLQPPDCNPQTATPRLQPPDCNPQTATPRLQPPDCNPQTATPRLQPPDCNPQTASPRLQPPDCNPQTATPRLQPPDCNPQTATPDCNPQTATPRLQPPDCNPHTAPPIQHPPDCNPQTATPRLQPPRLQPQTDFLGMAEFKISQVLTAEDKTIQLPLSKGEKSTVTIKGEECGSAREVFTFGVSASALNNVELLSKSDPFLEICRQHDDGKWLPIYKTEVIDNNLNPSWRPIRVKASQLTHGEPKRPLKLRVYDFESNGRHKLIGQATIDSVILQKASSENQPILLTSHDKPAGQLHVRDFQIEVEPTFIDYFQGGIEMKFVVAIDFTGSNGPPTHPQSLHYINPNGAQTHYEKAITGVGRVIEAYDSDRNFPVWGFGGQRPPQTTQHCFPVGDDPNGICVGVDGILEAYRKSLFQWNLAGPTLFNPIIEAASRIAAQPADHIKYMVLLILTDGEIMDMRESVRAIIAASKLPMSILIVGVGSSPELVNMEVLDSDKVKLESNGNIAERDIVQFVQFNKFQNDGNALANELLAELPGQFLAYMKTNKIPVPMPPPAPEFAKGTAAVESTISFMLGIRKNAMSGQRVANRATARAGPVTRRGRLSVECKVSKICILPGDGIGPEIMNVATKVLTAAGRMEGEEFVYTSELIGGAAIDATGKPLPEQTLATAKASDSVLLAAIGG
eukprot:gene2793-12668_t